MYVDIINQHSFPDEESNIPNKNNIISFLNIWHFHASMRHEHFEARVMVRKKAMQASYFYYFLLEPSLLLR